MRLNWLKTLPSAYKSMKELQNFTDQSRLEPKLKELVKVRASR
jgi:hypothetical protein